MKPSLKKLGMRIRLRRVEMELSQEKLAHKAHINMTYLGRIERGEKNPTFLMLERIATALDTSVSELVQGL